MNRSMFVFTLAIFSVLLLSPIIENAAFAQTLPEKPSRELFQDPSSDDAGLGAADTSEPSLATPERIPTSEADLSEGYGSFAFFTDEACEIVVGVDKRDPESVSALVSLVDGVGGEIINRVMVEGETIALVISLTSDALSFFRNELQVRKLSRYVEPRIRFQANFIPDDPYWSGQWGPQKIQADWAWNATAGDPSIIVAVVDTGVEYLHPDLAHNYVPLGYDWTNNDPDPWDDHGHGTHCAGIIAASMNNSRGIAGLAQVKIMAEKGLDASGQGYDDWLANAIIHAVQQNASIIGMSWGGYTHSQLIYEAITYAYDAGVLLVASAGNENVNMKSYPAAYEEVIAVAATSRNDGKATFSNWGEWIELAAPGVDILSTVPWGYEAWSGTSMACPHVTGVAALAWSKFPDKSRDWVRLWLRHTADDLGQEGKDTYYGYGRVNARKAVEQTPPAHELVAYEWRPPTYVTPGNQAATNATIVNFGQNDQTNVTIQLLANSTVVDSMLLVSLVGGNSATVNLKWNPIMGGLYNVTLYVVPLAEETNLRNNILWEYVYAGLPVKAVVLHSAGNMFAPTITCWQALSNEWYRFGSVPIYVDYTMLDKESITYGDIAASEADVLIISCAFDPSMGWQFTNEEIEAIRQYVLEGHRLIATAGTFYSAVPNNNKLAPLFGLNETNVWSETSTDLLHASDVSHPLFTHIPDPFIFPIVSTVVPSDLQWDSNELAGGSYVALGNYLEDAIVTYEGNVFISPWLEVAAPYYHYPLQLLYNTIVWGAVHIAISTSSSVGLRSTNVIVNGSNVTPNTEVSIFWDNAFMENATATAFGSFSYTLTIPEAAKSGVHEIGAMDTATGRIATALFRVIVLTLNPTEGPVGTRVTANGAGFSPGTQVTLTFNDAAIGHAMVDESESFNLTFNVPLSDAGLQTVKILDGQGLYASQFTVLDITPLDINIDVGATYFIGESVVFYAQPAYKGHAVNATAVNAVLYGPDGTAENLTIQPIATGLYRIPYTISGNITGTYALVVEASHITDTIQAQGTSLKCFLVSDTFTLMNKQVVEVKDGLATVQTDLGLVKLNLTAMDVTLENIFISVIAINGTTASLQTKLGMIDSTITSIDDNVATIQVQGLGQIRTDISELRKTQEAWVIPQYAILTATLAVAVGILVLVILLRRRNQHETRADP